MKPIEAMSLDKIQAQLRSYQPGSAAAVNTTEPHLARRQQLWRRLDQLIANAACTHAIDAGSRSSHRTAVAVADDTSLAWMRPNEASGRWRNSLPPYFSMTMICLRVLPASPAVGGSASANSRIYDERKSREQGGLRGEPVSM